MTTQAVLQKYGTQLLFSDATDFSGGDGPPATAANSLIIGTPTVVQIDCTDLAAAAGRQSDKTATLAHTGTAWPIQWVLGACVEHVATPTAGQTVEFYWNASPSATAGTGNSGGCTGADGAFTVAGKSQLILIGVLVLQAATININADVGRLWMPHLYGSLVVVNVCPTKAMHSAMDEQHFTLTPIIDDIQAAA